MTSLSAEALARFDERERLAIESRSVSGADAAVAAARDLDGPVALKASARGLIHKTDAGGVRLGVEGPGAVQVAAERIEELVEHDCNL